MDPGSHVGAQPAKCFLCLPNNSIHVEAVMNFVLQMPPVHFVVKTCMAVEFHTSNEGLMGEALELFFGFFPKCLMLY